MYGEPVDHRGHRAAGPLHPARDRPPRRHPVHRPDGPRAAQGRDEGDPRGRVGRRARADRQGQPARDCSAGAVSLRLVFAGTPEVALPVARRAARAPATRCVAVVTRPDAPAGRGRGLRAVAGRGSGPRSAASRCSRRTARASRSSWSGCASSPRTAARSWPTARWSRGRPSTSRAHGWVNLHFSLLPAWRGAAPVQHAIMAGDEVTGASHLPHRGGAGHRAGLRRDDRADPPRRHRRRPARPARRRRAPACSSPPWTASRTARSTPVPQPADGVSLAPKITVDDARVDWARPAVAVDRLVRGCTPAPGAWTTFRGERVKLGPVQPSSRGADGAGPRLAPGELARQRARGPGRHRDGAGAARRGAARTARSRCRRPTGPAASGSTAGSAFDR